MNKATRIAGLAVLGAALAGALATLFVRDQISRHQRNLFSERAVRRLAALRHMARERATVDNIRLLRDFISWEPRRLLRKHALTIVSRMEQDLGGVEALSGGGVSAGAA